MGDKVSEHQKGCDATRGDTRRLGDVTSFSTTNVLLYKKSLFAKQLF